MVWLAECWLCLRGGVQVDRYVAYEIDKYAIQTSAHNFPMIEHKGDVFQADFTEYEGFDFLVGGSPCTYWSIAKTKNRETQASGMGWDLFSQYVRALKEAKPKYFIYENNKSMASDIRSSISGAFGFEPICINSALVSAQNRNRLYWCGIRQEDGSYRKADIAQPEDQGILLKDILETCGGWVCENDKAYCLCGKHVGNTRDYFKKRETNIAFKQVDCANPEPINTFNGDGEKSRTVMSGYYKYGTATLITNDGFKGGTTAVAEPIECYELDGESIKGDGRRIGRIVSGDKNKNNDSQQYRVYTTDDKSVTLCGSNGSMGKMTGLYIVNAPTEQVECCSFSYPHGWNDGIFSYDKFANLTTGSSTRQQNVLIEKTDKTQEEIGKPQAFCNKIYEVENGLITIKDKQYPIKLADGHYIIRKLTVVECMRLQTVPEWYEFPVSNSQAYKMLGNGWTVKVISHLIQSILRSANND